MTEFGSDDLASFGLDDASAFVASAGLVLDSVSGTRVTGHIDLGRQHHTPWGVVHGGVFTTAVETAASIGASVAVQDRGQFAVGVHNSTDFITASTNGRADVVAEPLQQGRISAVVAGGPDSHRRTHDRTRAGKTAERSIAYQLTSPK